MATATGQTNSPEQARSLPIWYTPETLTAEIKSKVEAATLSEYEDRLARVAKKAETRARLLAEFNEATLRLNEECDKVDTFLDEKFVPETLRGAGDMKIGEQLELHESVGKFVDPGLEFEEERRGLFLFSIARGTGHYNNKPAYKINRHGDLLMMHRDRWGICEGKYDRNDGKCWSTKRRTKIRFNPHVRI